MSNVLFTMPGKIGDNLAKVPVIYQYWKQTGIKSDVCLDKESYILKDFFSNQPWADNVFISEGVTNYGFGGQPFDFGKDAEFRQKYKDVYHLGYKTNGEMPNIASTNLTEVALAVSKCPIDPLYLLSEPSIEFEKKKIKNLCIHIDTHEEFRAEPAKNTILPILEDIMPYFENIYFLGLFENPSFYDEFKKFDNIKFFDDEGDLNKVVDLLSESLLIGTFSSMWVLASLMKIDQIVIRCPRINWTNKESSDKETWFDPYKFDDIKDLIKKIKKQNGI